jgi:hypothetical protein
MPHFLFYGFLLFLFAVNMPYSYAQHTNNQSIRLLITDINNGYTFTLDTILPIDTDINLVLKKLGYDQQNLAKSQNTLQGRRVTVATEKVVSQNTTTIAEPNLGLSYDLNTTKHGLKADDFIEIPPNATITETHQGTVIINDVTDANGNTYSQRKVVKAGHGEDKVLHGRSGMTEWIELDDGKLPPTVDQARSSITETYSRTTNGITNTAKITLSDIDQFDKSTIAKKDSGWNNAQPLTVNNFSVKPDFKANGFVFNFDLPNGAAQLHIFDIIGSTVYHENISSTNYHKIPPPFQLHQKGTYLIILQQNDRIFSQKLSIE